MASIGAEVGQKMRSAIKAKLLELNCYVDDELPDYVMVMVANKRTKSQMKEDLQLFLAAKTGAFVDWLHIVLKKLKEVTVTNPEVYKKTAKRKPEETPSLNVKKEKKEKKPDKKVKTESEEATSTNSEASVFASLTDDLPINANRLSKQRKIIIMKENQSNNRVPPGMQDNFDIPLLSEVNMSTEEELEDIERKIKTVKSRLGLMVESDQEEDQDGSVNLKTEQEEISKADTKSSRKIQVLETSTVSEPAGVAITEEPKRAERARITFNSEELESSSKRKSILDRLGKRRSSENAEDRSKSSKKTKPNTSEQRNEETRRDRKEKRSRRDRDDFRRKRDEEKPKEGVLSRLGVMSKVSVPAKQAEEPEEPFKTREVPSMVKIKPRVIPHDAPQANKNLLLKAVAEAQRSIAQTPKVGNTLKPDALFTKKYKEQGLVKKLPENEKNKIKKILTSVPESENDEEYPPAPSAAPKRIQKTIEKSPSKFVSSAKVSDSSSDSDENSIENGNLLKQKFIVTLDGIEKTKFKDLAAVASEETSKPSIKSRLDKKKSPSPIIFDSVKEPVALAVSTPKPKLNIPDKLPIVHASPSVKNKERCKYWPGCRQGDKCEFVHPTTNCEKFPHCKFGDKCLYLHPNCKFASSCTRRGCVYNHGNKTALSASRVVTPSASTPQSLQTCKFFPNCINVNCSFYHPKPCKFGKYCKNQSECNFSHSFAHSKSSLIWRSK